MIIGVRVVRFPRVGGLAEGGVGFGKARPFLGAWTGGREFRGVATAASCWCGIVHARGGRICSW